MNTYVHPGNDWAHVEHLLEPERSPVRSVIGANLPWFKKMLQQRGGTLLMVSNQSAQYGTLGAFAISADDVAAIVHFYFVSYPYENSEALYSLYAAMIRYAEGRRVATIRLPVIVEFAKAAHLDFFGNMSTMKLDSQWFSGHIVRTYNIPIAHLKEAVGQ